MSSGVETRPTKPPKFAVLIDESLGQVQRKICLADLARGLLAMTALTFGYLLIAASFDLATGGGSSVLVTAVRLGLFGVFAAAFVLLGGWTLIRYLTRVNPYFAARRLEETIPDAKNSLINWLDLRDDAQIPPAIYQAVGLRAAKDVESADPELVVSTKETTRLGITIGVFALALGLMFLFVPHQFRSLLGRAMMPFAAAPVPPPTIITLVKPANGDAVVAANTRVDILAIIEGQIADAGTPEAPALHFRNDPTDVFQRVPLEENRDGWGVRLTPEQIRSGLTYKLTAGLASTPEHRLTVRTQAFVSEFEVTYRYRAYRKAPPETVVFPNVTAHVPSFLERRGTEVDLTIRTNTSIAKGYLKFESAGKNWFAQGMPVAEDPKALRFQFSLDRSGTVRVEFEAPGGERNTDRDPYDIRVLDDDAPSVKLVEPGKDIAAPANGTLLLVGKAFDDFGVTGLTLKVRVPGKKDPIAQPYRARKAFQFKDGTYPSAIEYFDTLHLDRLQLAAGTELEYWLEATDNCDYPKPNVGKSATYKLKLVTPDTDPKNQKSQSDKAVMQAKAGQKQQDDKNGSANGEKGDNKDGKGPGDKGTGDKGNDKGGPNDGDKGNNKGDKAGENGSGNQGSSPNQDKAHKDQLEKDLAKTAEPLSKELDKNGQNNQSSDSNPKGGNSDGKSDNPKKDDGESQGGDGKTDNSQSQDKKSANASNDPKAGDPKSEGVGDSGNPKAGKEKDDPSKSPSKESGNASNGSDGGGDDAKKDSGNAKDKKDDNSKSGEKGNETQSGSKVVGTQPDKSPADSKDPASKTGNNGESGTQKSTDKKEGAEKADGPVGKDAKTEAAKTPSDKAKTATDVQPPPGAKGTASKNKKDDLPSGKPPEPTREEIDTLGKLLKQKAPEADKMAKDLVQRGLDMTNADNKKALQDTLQNAGRPDDVAKLNGEESLPPPMPGNAGQAPMPSKDGNEKAMAKGTGGKKDGGKKGDEFAANTGGGAGYNEKLKEITPDEEFRRKLGNLQIDDIEALKRRISKKVREDAGVSDQEWQQFLKNAAEYKRLIERHRPAARPDEKTLTGGKSQIAGQGPRRVDASPGATQSSLEGAAAAPPPEFEDAQRAFTGGKKRD
ncbi:MAG TPA: hypothetical protein VHR72_14590 [Gemmataceae bacterium]|nr:hypothetical protein [Gemmataceae bacterium]